MIFNSKQMIFDLFHDFPLPLLALMLASMLAQFWQPFRIKFHVFRYSFFPQHMLRLSFSPGRGRACRHCWIDSF